MNKNFNYFQDADTFIIGNKYLRDPQRKAYQKLVDEFSKDCSTHKIVVLATGAGKTGVIAIAPYKISYGRVLVITPSLIIREGISDEFDTRTDFNFWTDKKVILDDNQLPKVYRYAGYKTQSDKKRVQKYLDNSNIVIANIHKVYNTKSEKPLVNLLDRDFFDMIIIDEAHHSAAESWIKTLEYFKAKKIIKLTATPYRADEKELGGKIVYTYDLADAIKDKIVKNIVAEDYTTQKLEFEVNGQMVDKETALQVMDKNWVTRSVAYSEECSKTIVKMSIERLKEKRRLGRAHHQIIAIACSILHAKQIMKLYEEFNLKADYVASDRKEASREAIINFKKGKLDVLVNVDMLAEGFDHPNISIAAIFRPFRTLSPYAQFIGRALRKIQGSDVDDKIDNVAHVIYHKELDLDELWSYYTGQKEKSDRKKFLEYEYNNDYIEDRNRNVGSIVTEGKIIKEIETFLDDDVDQHYSNAIKERVEQIEDEFNEEVKKMKQAHMSEDLIQQFKEFKRKQLNKEIDERRNKLREELIREELHDQYNKDVISKVDELYEKTNINPKGIELPESSTSPFLRSTKNNSGYIMRYINNTIKQRLKRGIDEWETFDFQQAEEMLPEVIHKLEEKIERKGCVINECHH